MKCSRAGCNSDAVIQWTQLLGSEAIESHIGWIRSQLEARAEERKLGLRIQIAALQEARDNPPKNLEPADVVSFQERADKQIEGSQQQHDAVATDFDLEHHREGSSRSLGHCGGHRYGDLEWYARMHVDTCDGSEGCGCS